MRICDFCLESEYKAMKLIETIHHKDNPAESRSVHICDQCVDKCHDIVESSRQKVKLP